MKFSYKVSVMLVEFAGSQYLENIVKNNMGHVLWYIGV